MQVKLLALVSAISINGFLYTAAIASDSGEAAPLNTAQYEKIIDNCSKDINDTSGDFRSYLSRGIAFLNTAQYEKAMEDFSKVIELNPNEVRAYCGRGAAHLSLAQYEKAIDDCAKAIDLSTEGKKNGGKNDKKNYVDLNKYLKTINSPSTFVDPEILDKKMKEDQHALDDNLGPDPSESESSMIIELNPTLEAAYNNRGQAYWRLRQFQKAIDDYSKAIDLRPKAAAAYYNRGSAYGSLGLFQSAIDDYTKVLKLMPKLGVAYYSRGQMYQKYGKPDLSAADMEKAQLFGFKPQNKDQSN